MLFMSSRKNYSELKKKTNYLKYQLHVGNGPTQTLDSPAVLSLFCDAFLFDPWMILTERITSPSPPLWLIDEVLKAVAITTLCQIDQENYLFFCTESVRMNKNFCFLFETLRLCSSHFSNNCVDERSWVPAERLRHTPFLWVAECVWLL